MVRIDLSAIKDLLDLNINSKELINLLITILEKSESAETRLELLEFLNEYDLRHSSFFEMFENHLISDAQEEIRRLAAELIIRNFMEEGLDALEWTINNDPSPLVLDRIYALTKELNSSYIIILESMLFEKFKEIAQKYKIVVEEVPFLLELGVKFMDQNFYIGNQDFYFIYENYILCIIKEKHITELGISFIEEVPDTIGLLTKLEHLDLSFGYISTLPNSMENLKNLKSINLCWNEFSSIPKVLKSLKKVKNINITNNKLKGIPEWASKVTNLIV